MSALDEVQRLSCWSLDALGVEPVDECSESDQVDIAVFELYGLGLAFEKLAIEGGGEEWRVVGYDVLVNGEWFGGADLDCDEGLRSSGGKSACARVNGAQESS